MRKAPVVILAALLAAASAQGSEPAKTEKAAPMKLAFAGVKIALPAEFKLVPIESGNMLLRAVKVRGEEPLLLIVLSAYQGAPKTTLAEFASSRSPSKDLWVRSFRTLKSMAVKVAGVDGEVQVQSYRRRGLDTTALGLYFLRPVAGDKGQVGYVLMVEAEKRNGKLTLPVLMAVMKTIELFDPVSPLAEPLEPLYEPIVSEKWGYSIRPPTWWKVSMSPQEDAIKIFQLDYTFAVRVHPELHFAASNAPGQSAAQCMTKPSAGSAPTSRRREPPTSCSAGRWPSSPASTARSSSSATRRLPLPEGRTSPPRPSLSPKGPYATRARATVSPAMPRRTT